MFSKLPKCKHESKKFCGMTSSTSSRVICDICFLLSTLSYDFLICTHKPLSEHSAIARLTTIPAQSIQRVQVWILRKDSPLHQWP